MKSLKVLVVEDDDAVRELICRLIGHMGYVSCDSASGVGALAVVRLQAPDVVLMDWVMPGLARAELFGLIRRAPRAERAEIIVMSAHPGARLEMTREGVDARFLAKPFELDDLEHAVRAAAELRGWTSGPEAG